jgi:hypothetical protein
VVCAFLFPQAASSDELDLHLIIQNDVISTLNPANAFFDVIYESGPVKTADETTTVGSWMWVGTRSNTPSMNYFDGVIALPGGNTYFKLLQNFGDGSRRGVILGGDGTLAGITGGIRGISGTLYRFTFTLP